MSGRRAKNWPEIGPDVCQICNNRPEKWGIDPFSGTKKDPENHDSMRKSRFFGLFLPFGQLWDQRGSNPRETTNLRRFSVAIGLKLARA